jgi:archaellum component FlaG (FlaF/FlaG flagellin family)
LIANGNDIKAIGFRRWSDGLINFRGLVEEFARLNDMDPAQQVGSAGGTTWFFIPHAAGGVTEITRANDIWEVVVNGQVRNISQNVFTRDDGSWYVPTSTFTTFTGYIVNIEGNEVSLYR